MLLVSDIYLEHHGIKGQKWGQRNYQYEDGRLTPEGKLRYSHSSSVQYQAADINVGGGGGVIEDKEELNKNELKDILKFGLKALKITLKWMKDIKYGNISSDPSKKSIAQQGKELTSQYLSKEKGLFT